jgi:hypothetical protein
VSVLDQKVDIAGHKLPVPLLAAGAAAAAFFVLRRRNAPTSGGAPVSDASTMAGNPSDILQGIAATVGGNTSTIESLTGTVNSLEASVSALENKPAPGAQAPATEALYVVGTNPKPGGNFGIWEWLNGKWGEVPGAYGTSLTSDALGDLFVANKQGQLWEHKYNAATGQWVIVPGGKTSGSIAGGGYAPPLH